MSITLDDATNLLKSVLTIIAIPIAYLQTRKTNYDRAIALINEVATTILLRLYNHQFIARDEIKQLIKTKALSKKINHKSVLIDDVANKIIEKVEETPFISKQKRRSILEKTRTLKESRESRKLLFYVFIKNNEKDLITATITISVLAYLLFPPKKDISNYLLINQQITKELFIGLLILLSIIILIYFISGAFNPRIFQGHVKLLPETYHRLPSFHNEFLKLTDNKSTEYFLELSDANFKEENKVVETDPGCLSLGIVRFTKKHQNYSITVQRAGSVKYYFSKIYNKDSLGCKWND